MSPRKPRSLVPEEDAPVHRTRNKTRMATAQDIEAVSQSTRAPRGARPTEPAASKSGSKDKGSNNTKTGVSGSAKASAAAAKKQKQTEEKRRQQGKYDVNVTDFTAI